MTMTRALALLLAAAASSSCTAKMIFDPLPSTANCSELFYEQTIDHFNWQAPAFNPPTYTYKQRYFTYDKFWHQPKSGPKGPIFFYFGNEDNVGLYVNHTGLMWENARDFGALLVFAEHRYYGRSMPFPPNTQGCMGYLTTEQAMADFATLIDHLRSTLDARSSAVVGFGGSYGGMVGAWFRIKYPNAVDGVIAASAPIWSFVGLEPAYNYQAFNEGVTYDMSSAGGADDLCKENMHYALQELDRLKTNASERTMLSSAFRTCHELQSEQDVEGLIDWAQGPWGNMAMGNYPYRSTYLMHGKSYLPAWPVRAACKPLQKKNLRGRELFEAVREAVAVQNNNTGTKRCFYNGDSDEASAAGTMRAGAAAGKTRLARIPGKRMTDPWRTVHVALHGHGGEAKQTPGFANTAQELLQGDSAQLEGPARCQGDWGYQWCTEMTQPFSSGCNADAKHVESFAWPCSHYNFTASAMNCRDTWGVTPREHWAKVGLGGKRIEAASNIVFSNGRLDPWHGGGILTNISESLLSVVIPSGAHHIDLMFSDPLDPPDVLAAREFEVAQMHKWVKQANARRKHVNDSAAA